MTPHSPCSQHYWQMKEDVIRTEQILLRVFAFDLEIAHPHIYLLHFIRDLEGNVLCRVRAYACVFVYMCMFVYVCMCACVYVCVCLCVCVCECLCVCVCVSVCVCVCACEFVWMIAFMCVCVCGCIYVRACMFVSMCARIRASVYVRMVVCDCVCVLCVWRSGPSHSKGFTHRSREHCEHGVVYIK
jgi:hypothetical protein